VCGISGIINKSGDSVKLEHIKKITDIIAHRGPDDEGYYLNKNFSFGHRRLSILDLSSSGHQPMNYENKYTITYNGEIYNYIELKRELCSYGYKFISETDTEVILASYDKWGKSCVNKFNGMWAFAIYDSIENIIFCSRDRFGIKPFYYTETDREFVFGSEIKQLLDFHGERIVNETILLDYFLYGFEEHTNETFFKNIYKLEQSHSLVYDLENNKVNIYQYYDLEIKEGLSFLSENDSIELIKHKLYRATLLRLRSDVQVGTCLSGGLDSSLIAAFASQQYSETQDKKKFLAIHAKSIEEKTDESYFARKVAAECDLNLVIVEPQLEDITKSIHEVVYTQEEPFGGISIFMQYFVMREAKKVGCKVMLDGQGGDETLFGYEGYLPFYFASLLYQFKFLQYILELKKIDTFMTSKSKIIKDSLISLFHNELSYLKRAVFRQAAVRVKDERNHLNELYKFVDFKQFQKRDLLKRHLPQLLKYEDKNSMKNSIETRLPYVDFEFVSNAISINDKLKFKDGYLKYILRKVAEKVLPIEVVWRKNKFGFEAPEETWIKEHRNMMISQIQESNIIHTIIKNSETYFGSKTMLWKLYNIAVWEKVFNVKVSDKI